jgi:hypothetical protein
MSEMSKEASAFDKAKADFDAAQESLAEATQLLNEATEALDQAIVAAQGEPHPHQDQIDRMAYIQAQAAQRAARFGVAESLREDAPRPDEIDPRSALDKSMQRKTARGTARPKKEA